MQVFMVVFDTGVADNVDNDIMNEEWDIAMDDKRWLTLTYANGPGFFDHRFEGARTILEN